MRQVKHTEAKWLAMKTTYISRGDEPSLDNISREFKIWKSQLAQRASKEEWRKQKEAYWEKAQQQILNKKVEGQVNRLIRPCIERMKKKTKALEDFAKLTYQDPQKAWNIIIDLIKIYNRNDRNSTEIKEWRDKVFKRDGYICQHCHIKGKRLNAHHIKSFSDYPELRTNINNGITLCEDCHRKTKSYGRPRYVK